jgi:hypothetical protein
VFEQQVFEQRPLSSGANLLPYSCLFLSDGGRQQSQGVIGLSNRLVEKSNGTIVYLPALACELRNCGNADAFGQASPAPRSH